MRGTGIDPRFPFLSYTSDLKLGTIVATLPDVLCYGVSASTGRSCVSKQFLGEAPSLRYTSMLLGH